MAAVSWREMRDAQHQGTVAAVRQTMRLGLDPNQPVDIMKVIVDSPIILMWLLAVSGG